ncbi:MAG: AAA family ATPase, partial [Bauldia sp.]|nr:AAA family ATPase [Bauldia sp.]
MSEIDIRSIAERLDQLVRLVERAVPPAPAAPDFSAADAFVWQPDAKRLQPVPRVNRVELNLLKGIDR